MSSSVIARPRPRAGRTRGNGLTHAVLIVASLLMIFPFVWQILMSLATNAQVTSVPPTVWPGTLHFENFAHVFDQLPFLNQLWVSVAVTVIRTVGQLLLCSMAGYAFARMEFPFRRTIFALVLAILMVPPQVYLLPQYQIVQGLGWLNTIAGIAAPGIFSAFGTFLMRQFFSITVPLLTPSIFFVSVITVITGFQLFDLLYALMGTQNPAINQTQSLVYLFFAHQQTGDNGYAAAVGVAILVLVGAFTMLQFRMQKRWVNYV